MTRPIKQIGDEIRELNDEEMVEYERDASQQNEPEEETPTE